MTDFIIKQRNPYKVLDILREMIPQFPRSEEFQELAAEDQMVPGLVCAAFARYLARLQMSFSRENAFVDDRSNLERCYETIERLASDFDLEIQNLVVVEVFENISSKTVLSEMVKRLKPNSRALYSRWIE